MSRACLDRRELLRRAAGAGALLATGSLAPGCLGDDGTQAPTATGPGKVVVGAERGVLTELVRPALERYGEASGTTLEIRDLSAADWPTALRDDALRGGGFYDLYLIDDAWLPELAAAGALAEIEAADESTRELLPATLDLGRWPPPDGPRMTAFAGATPRLVALPVLARPQLLWTREDVIAQPAVNWNELAAGARLAARGPTPRSGFALAGAPGMPALAGYLPFLLSYGGVLFDDGWQTGFAGEEGIGALVRMLGLLRFLPEDAEDADEERAAEDLLDGRAVTVIARAELGARADDAPGPLVGARPPAQTRPGSDMAALLAAVPVHAANPRGGRALVRWLASREAQVSLARAGAPAASREAIADDTARSRHPWLDGLATTAPIALAPPRLPDIAKVSEVLGTRIHDAIVRAQATRRDFALIATEALRGAAAEIETYLTRQGGYYS